MPRRRLTSPLLGPMFAGVLRLSPALVTAGLGGLAGCQLHAASPSLPAAATPAAFTVGSTEGGLDSAAALVKGPLVLIFYRGHW